MKNASGPGPNDPSSRLTPRPPGTPGDEDSGYEDSNAAGRNTAEESQRASDTTEIREHRRMAESDPEAQPVDPALVAGGEDMVGVANDMTTGPDTMGATTGGERASAGHADGSRSSRNGGNSGDV